MAHSRQEPVLLIHTPAVSNRLRYIVHLLFDEICGVKTAFTRSAEEYRSYEGPKIAYVKENPGTGLFMEASGLLFEQTVYPHTVTVDTYRKMPILYKSSRRQGGFPFDLLAASFYLVSRYEEYASRTFDKFGRFPASQSLALREGFLDKPVVNIWLKLLTERLGQEYRRPDLCPGAYRYIPTLDIDHAYAFRCRSLLRTLGGIGRALSHGHPGEIADRLRVLTRMAPDPYDTFEYVREVHERHHLPTLWFVLFADYGGNDNNIPVRSRGFSRLLKELAGWSDVGIHPSLSSHKHRSRLHRELEGLSDRMGGEITKSRQHFLKFSFPSTFIQLINLGITEDYSMGYASHPGFRAGIAHPFRFFDLTRNEETSLRIHPVPVMDVTFRDYLQLDPGESLNVIKQIIGQVRSHNGECVTLWHNESLSEYGRWRGWRGLYEKMVDYASH